MPITAYLARWSAPMLGAGLFFLAPGPAGAQVVVSEFMAANATGLQDEDGDYSDWIEIHNAGGTPVELDGWHLTDAETNLTRWTFPATHLPAGGFLVVFASGKDRTAPNLHAGFSLATEGEYLALVRPDGTTIEHSYAPAYPGQFPDISYGLQTHGTNPTLRAGKAGYLIYRTPGTTNACLPAAHPLFSDDSVARIDLAMSQSTWDWLHWDNPETEVFRSINLRFRHGDIDLTVTNVGIQCRGYTSLTKKPRSFNIAFNAFVPGQRLLDLERLNLNSDANDPSMARPKLLNDLANALDLPTSHANHAAVVVSNTSNGSVFFDAVRNNTQPVDDVFLEQRFGTARGNLYKCNHRQWQATLEYRGATGSAYIGDGTTYELKYAGGGDTSYSDFAALVALINQTSDANFPNAIMQAFEVDEFLRRMAFDVLTGNWDNYWGNANNYHLFLHPETRRWIYIPYDFDNALGVSWDSGAVNWATRSITNWSNFSGSTPLATRIMAVAEFKNRYRFYMRQILDSVFDIGLTNSLYHYRAAMTAPLPFPHSNPVVNNMKSAEKDNYQFSGTWNWTYDHFWYSYDFAQYSHNSSLSSDYRDMAITNFIGVRRAAALSQLGTVPNIGPILSGFAMAPSLPRSNDAIAVSIRAVDDVAVSNVTFYHSFNGGPTNSMPMVLQPDGLYATSVPAFGATGTLRYLVRAADNTGKAIFHPYGGSNYAASVEIGSGAFDLVITELNYNPYDLTPQEIAAGVTDPQNLEFVELFNAGAMAMNLTGFKLQDGITATFPVFTLNPGEYAVAVKSTNQFRVRYTNTAIRIIGVFSGNLSNGGETIRLENAAGGVILNFTYDDGGDWPGRADGDGSSLEIKEFRGDYNDPANWRSSSEYGGSPGRAGRGPDNRIVVNEVLTHTDPPLSDSIELFNTTEGALDISGWYLSDTKANYCKYAISAGTILPAGGYIAFNETNHFNTSGGANTNDFALDGAHGEDVYLLETDGQGRLAGFVDRVEFGPAANGESFGRWPNGSGRLYPMISRTFGSINSGPRTGPVVISEIMYQPPSGSNHLEFIEIANPGSEPEELTRWQLDTGVTFAFPAGTILPPGAVLVVLSFDPQAASNSIRLADFQAVYGITNEVFFAGPYAGFLADTGERIRLLRPDEPPAGEPAYYPMLIEDEVEFGADLPWPAEAAGGGASLARLAPAAWGDSFTSWSATAPPTPGVPATPLPTHELTVVSEHGEPLPAVGPHVVVADTFLSNSVPSPVTQGSTRYLCTGWTLAGNDPDFGATNWMTMTLTNDATLTWRWGTNFLLATAADAGGSVQPGEGWHAPGAVIALEAVASNLYAFTGWTGDTNAIVSGDASSPAVSVQMGAPVTLIAHFEVYLPVFFASRDGTHTEPYTNWAMAATSLHAVVDYAPAGATVLVAAAVYPLPATLSISKALRLKSADGPGAAILDGGNAVRVLLLSHAEAVVEGFTIQNGFSGASSGGGVRIEPAGRVFHSIIRSNVTQSSGGGAALIGGGELRNCLIHANTANDFNGGTPNDRGGGVYTYTEGTAPILENCTLADNSAGGGGGGVYLNESATLRNSIAWGNTAGSGSNLVILGTGHLLQYNLTNANPFFVNAAGNDFRLAAHSPGIDTGTNLAWMAATTDLDGRPRVIHDRVDMGPYEAILPEWDSDADGLPDWWEWAYSRTLTEMDPDAHDDSDHLNNAQELRAGTDPFDGHSFLGLRSAGTDFESPGRFVLNWSSATGRTYRIGYSTNLNSPFESTAYSNISADPPDNTFTGSLAQPGPAFYRIELE